MKHYLFLERSIRYKQQPDFNFSNNISIDKDKYYALVI